ncbi:MAG: glycosyltransferase family 4 protein [Clostridia bacterium]
MLITMGDVFCCLPDGEFIEKIESLGCKYVPCKVLERRSINPVKDFRLLRFYDSVLKDIHPDIVLTYTIKPNVYGGLVCRLQKIPYIANITGLGTTIENGGLLSKISMTMYKVGLKYARCVFFQNKSNQNLLIKKRIVKGKTKLIPGSGVNLESYQLEEYPSCDNGTRFLFVGRIMKEKGIEEFLESIKVIHNENPSVVADIVGFSDEDYTEALQKAEHAGYVRFHGIQNNVHEFYKQSHCVVLPSYHEGLANVLLEASSTGRPVITTRVPGCRETFEEDITGFGCEAKNSESLIEAMRKFLLLTQEKRKELGLNARKKMEREYDRAIVIEAYRQEITAAVRDW